MGKKAFYIRLSSEDVDSRNGDKDESNSVVNQRKLLKAYAEEKLGIVGDIIPEFVDDGYTGRNFERPGFQKLLSDCRCGNVDCIILKDLSRLGRNYVEVGNLLEQVFPFLGVRVISVNDGYDSIDYSGVTGGMDIALQNFIYTLYSRDLSGKVKSGLEILAKKGKYTGTYGFFGYRKCRDDIHKLEPDPDAAKIVRRIFEMVIAGARRQEVAAALNREDLPTPGIYRKMKGCTRDWYPNGKKAGWNSSMIAEIIRDERYAGHMVAHKTAYVDNEGRKQIRLPEDQWIIVRNTHEGIVTDEEFEAANSKLRKIVNKRIYTNIDKRAFSVFVCPYCGLRLHAPSSNNKMFCATGRIRPETKCASVQIDKDAAEDTLLKLVRKQAEVVIGATDIIKSEKRKRKNSLHKLLNEEGRIQKQIIGYKQQQISLYESFKSGSLTKEEFIDRKKMLKDEAAAVSSRMEELEKEIEVIQSGEQDTDALPIVKCRDLDTYDRRLMASLIERAEVYGEDKISVVWKHQDEYEKMIKLIS